MTETSMAVVPSQIVPYDKPSISRKQSVLHSSSPPQHRVEADSIAPKLVILPRWVCWDWKWTGKKWDKIPTDPRGGSASVSDPATWTDFATAELKSRNRNCGLGFVLNGDGIVGIDLDDCRSLENGVIDSWALDIISTINSYAEVSPSGTGVKVFVHGELPAKISKKYSRPQGGEVEVYCTSRYFTVTGHRVHGTPDDVHGRPQELADLIDVLKSWKPLAHPKHEREIIRCEFRNDDRDTALRALNVLDPTMDYDEWLRLGMALHSVDESLLPEWEHWSRNSIQFTEGECEKKWKSFGGDGVGIGTLCHMADQTGQPWRHEFNREIGETPEGISSRQEAGDHSSRTLKLRLLTAGELLKGFPSLRPYIVQDLLRAGETMNIISAPKFGKSWLVLGLLLCVACGLKWLGKFRCKQGRVLLIDNELHPETLASRLPCVADAMELKPDDYEDCVYVINLRGQLTDLEKLSAQLLTMEYGSFDLIVLDAWYRLQPKGSDENANGDVTQLYNLLDQVASKIGSAFVCVHHSSKGNQGGKAVTDVGSGAGAQARAPDVHMVMRAHDAEGAVVVDAAIRSSAPIEPFCMRWNWPTWTLADDLDPKNLRLDRPRKKGHGDPDPSNEAKQEQRELVSRFKVLQAYSDQPGGNTESRIREAAGLNGCKFPPVQSFLLQKEMIEPCSVKRNNGASYPGHRITASGLNELGQLGQQLGHVPSDSSDTTRTSCPPLGAGVSPSSPKLTA